MSAPAVPCKRPKISVIRQGDGLHRHECEVPGCGWTFVSIKSAEEVAWHKEAHRKAVPALTFEKSGTFGVVATCSCGRTEKRGTKTDAEAWGRFHLVEHHGLVVCP